MFWILLALLSSTAAHAQGVQHMVDEGAPDACRDVEAYKDKVPENDSDYLQVWWNAGVCENWSK